MIFDTHAHYDDEAFDADREDAARLHARTRRGADPRPRLRFGVLPPRGGAGADLSARLRRRRLASRRNCAALDTAESMDAAARAGRASRRWSPSGRSGWITTGSKTAHAGAAAGGCSRDQLALAHGAATCPSSCTTARRTATVLPSCRNFPLCAVCSTAFPAASEMATRAPKARLVSRL